MYPTKIGRPQGIPSVFYVMRCEACKKDIAFLKRHLKGGDEIVINEEILDYLCQTEFKIP